MRERAHLYRYAEDYLRLARDTPNPQLKALLVRMAEVWDALAVHADRIAAERMVAENMPDDLPSRDAIAPHPPTDSPELCPRQADLISEQSFAPSEPAK
jgi:hypothetical protein